MLRVATFIAPSAIHGIGLFAAVPIAAGTLVWQLDVPFDRALDEVALAALEPIAQLQIERYAYVDPDRQVRVLCADDARFFNHADDANCRDEAASDGTRTVAVRDIVAGEELTWDYREQRTKPSFHPA
jgi:SET domain-containing protein